MTEHKLVIKGTLPGLNEYLKAERIFSKKHSCGNDMKKRYQFIICNAIRKQFKRLKIERPIHITYIYYEPSKRRDLDNIAAVAHKFIQDSLVICNVIENDGWKQITGFTDHFRIDRDNPRIEVFLVEKTSK